MIQAWFIFIILSVLVNAIGEIAQKVSVSSKDDISAETINFYLSIVQTVLSVSFIVVTGVQFDPNLNTEQIIQLTVGSVLAFFFFKFLYTSYKGNSASISQVIFSLSVFVSTFLGILFFNESATPSKFLGVTLIVTGVIIANYNKGEKLSKYNIYALIAALIYGFLASIDKSFSTTINPHYYQVLGAIGFGVTSLVLSGKKIIKESKQITKNSYKTILISAIAFTAFNKFTYMAYNQGGEVGRVDAINNTAIFLILLFEIFILKDTKNLKKKVLASILSVSGVLILGFL
jgi:uncharacterized membrane protein